MAGITNAPFRTLCREQGAGLFVSEMVTARALIERRPETLRMIVPGEDEWPRSVQLYSVDPTTMRAAVTMIGKENLADHIDMNFGCPVPKVTRKGGEQRCHLSASSLQISWVLLLKLQNHLEFQ
jgi:tRNA-dihydrouridine synthase